MDTALVVITLLSLALTGALLVYASRLQREQREREEARVRVLASEIQADPGEASRPAFREAEHGATIFAAREAPFRIHELRAEPAAATQPDVAIGHGGPAFGAALETAPSRSRFIIPVVGALVVALALGGIYLLSARPASPTRAAAATPAPASLELMALKQSRTGNSLSVSGVVRNPAGAASRKGVTAVVFVFDKAGTFVSSGRAPIDYQVLAPGDESPFSVTVPNAKGAARYRVSFRTESDVLPHVDRREAQHAAASRIAERSAPNAGVNVR